MESCPTQAVRPLVGLAAHKVTRDRYNRLAAMYVSLSSPMLADRQSCRVSPNSRLSAFEAITKPVKIPVSQGLLKTGTKLCYRAVKDKRSG
ncbi:MAG: hypothetical protein ACQESR_24055 [Planctomycetota bacterium]